MIKMIKRVFTSAFLMLCWQKIYAANGSELLSIDTMAAPGISTSIWQMVVGLIVVLLVIFALAWTLRKVNGIQGSKAHIKIISAINVGTREKVVLIEVSGEQLLLGVAASGVNLLTKIERPITIETVDFASSLKQASAKLTGFSQGSKSSE